MFYGVTLLALSLTFSVPRAVQDPILTTRSANPATRTSYRELSHFYNHCSRGITGGATAEQKITAAFHYDFLDAFDN